MNENVWLTSGVYHLSDLFCYVIFQGKLCIEVTSQSKIVWISESLCIGCGICIKVIH